MPTLSASDYTNFIKAQAASYAYRDGLFPNGIQTSAQPYLKHDPTLPRFTNMKCPNPVCPTKGKESNIVGIKLDAKNVMWMYQCAACNSTWKQAARGP